MKVNLLTRCLWPSKATFAAQNLKALVQCQINTSEYNTDGKSSKFFFFVSSHRSYEQLGVKHEPLTLIQPQFETPLPPLQPAVGMHHLFVIFFIFSQVLLLLWKR